ncbi:MAG: hypothetical protein L6R38_009377 [Xanthoria sp. 2 TBL-2021]|nr:MAG: hypothetical protein L6R38_009377 [Xanthoria sp. 2 TBL-2021]
MPPFINPPFDYPREPPTVIKGLLGNHTITKSLLDNPTVTSNDKAIYVAGIIFTFLCLLLDVAMLAFIGYKLYRLCRRRRVGVVHGVEEVAGHEEKGLLMEGDEEGGEQLPAYHDDIDEDHNKENLSPITSNDNHCVPLPYGYLGPGDSYVITNIHGIKESITFPLTWYDLRDRGHVVQGLLDRSKIWADRHYTASHEDYNKENVVPLNKQVVSPTSKAAHLSPHKNCIACKKLAQGNSIISTDIHGVTESVTFPLTWDDMYEHRALIKWFLDSHNVKDFIYEAAYAFHDDDGNYKHTVSPTSKAAHLSPHENCEYCIALARANRLRISNCDGVEESVTFPLTMDDLLEHGDLIQWFLANGFKDDEVRSGLVTPKVQFD